LAALVGPATTLARGFLVGSIPSTLKEGGLSSQPGKTTIAALSIVSGIFLAQVLIRSINGGFVHSLSLLVDQHLEERVIRALGAPHGLSHLEGPEIANKLSILQGVGSAGYRPGNAVEGLSSRVQTWLSGLGSAVILAGFRWWVAIGLSAVYLWAARVTLRDYLVLMKLSSGQAPTIRRSHYYRDLAFVPPAAKEVRVFGLGDWLIDHFKQFWYQAMDPLWKERTNRRELGLASIVMSVSSIAAAAYVGFSALNAEFGIGSVTVFLGAIAGLYSFGSGYGPGDIQLQYGLSALPAIDEIEAAAKPLDPAGSQLLPENAPVKDIRFEEVSFMYPGTTNKVLDGLNLRIPAGKSTAIVGLNGAGKTTVVKLLCRFYEPESGQIFVDDALLGELDPAPWQRRLAAVFQDFVRYELTALDNVALGAPELAHDNARLMKAIDRSRATSVLDGLPLGLDTVLSREVTDGVQISGGEWQRLVLARALFAVESGARVLILDEPTAALDVRAEAEIYRSFLEITRGLTTILISHRFSTVRLADLIHVIQEGRVIESGTHEELMALGGRYAHMFNLQASRFAEEESQLP
ncbi:MAG TPA: ABC transporter ATP-binding protein, partial [Actinomycetota bacterium]|nr:ABC transporter ATP-binding protein [Actinomycetota bacterium]